MLPSFLPDLLHPALHTVEARQSFKSFNQGLKAEAVYSDSWPGVSCQAGGRGLAGIVSAPFPVPSRPGWHAPPPYAPSAFVPCPRVLHVQQMQPQLQCSLLPVVMLCVQVPHQAAQWRLRNNWFIVPDSVTTGHIIKTGKVGGALREINDWGFNSR